MGLINWLARAALARWARVFDAEARRPGDCQERMLLDLVRRAAGTQWGRAHDYAGIRTAADFQARVPLTTFEDVRPLWERVKAGEPDVIWPGRTRFFALSAGTTSGSKHIPVTAEAIRANRRAGAFVGALVYRQMGRRDPAGGRFLYLGGSTALKAEGQALIGDASGIMNAHVPLYARPFRLPGGDISALKNWERKVDRICERYLGAPVHVVAGLPSWLIPLFERLIEVGRRRIGTQVDTVSSVWPSLGAVLSYGMAVEPYRQTFERLIGAPVCYIDTYSSSEGGMTAVQDRQENGAGMALLVNNGVFYEFVPPGEADQERPRRYTVAEVETGVPYEVVLSTNGGLWGFRLGDVVRFVSLCPHRLVMVGRTQHQLSAFGEHVIGEELEKAVLAGCGATGAEVADFAVQAVYPRAAEGLPAEGEATGDRRISRGHHRWYVEFRRPPGDTERFMRAVDEHLKALNEDYAAYRQGDLAVARPELVALSRGSFHEWMRRSGRLGGQFKIPRVLTSAEAAENLLAVSDALAASR